MKTIKLIILLTGLLYVGLKLHQFYAPKTLEVKRAGKATIELSADSIKTICEMAGTSQRVSVLFDTSFVSQTPDIVVFGVALLNRDQIHRYSEQRVWQIKAGTERIEIDNANGQQTVTMSYPQILTSQELDHEFRILHNTTDNWSPAHLHRHVARSRRLAEAKAVRAGIQHRAAISIEDALRNLLPNSVKIKWENH